MKYPIARFTSLEEALKQLTPFVRNARLLETGRPLRKFYGLRPREMWANWLLCAVLNFQNQQADRWTFFSTSDPIGGDGVIYDTLTQRTFPTEHVFVPRVRRAGSNNTAAALILTAIEQKQRKGGDAYASGKQLVVFLDVDGGQWSPNVVTAQLPVPLYFADVWVISLQYVKDDDYIYAVTLLDLSDGNAPRWHVRIMKNFDAWEVRVLLAVIPKKRCA
jgi:hypothetical protein